MHFSDLETHISGVRLQNYLNHCGNDQDRALLLYKANIRLSKAFYPLLSILEINLRNGINEAMIKHFSNPDWLTIEKNGFMTKIGDKGRMSKLVSKAEDEIIKNGNLVTNDRIIAKLSFGFWTRFFVQNVFARVGSSSINAFPNLPSVFKTKGNLGLLNNELKAICDFRNKVYHNETICFQRGIFSLTSTKSMYNKIYLALSWFNPLFEKWVEDIDEVPYEFERINHCANNNGKVEFIFKINRLRVKRIYKKVLIMKTLYKQKI